MSRLRRRMALATAAALMLAACALDASGGEQRAELSVFAAASLTDAATELASAFADAAHAEHGEVDVVLNFAGSQRLAFQIAEGAPADVFAAADAAHLEQLEADGLLDGAPRRLARGRLAIAVERGNPLGVSGLADLAAPELVLVLPAEAVPAGRYARQALDRAGVAVRPDSLTDSVRSALAAVELGEADATVVYRSDVMAAGSAVDSVRIPARANVVAEYPIATLAGRPRPELARDFVDFALGTRGQRILRAHGFASP